MRTTFKKTISVLLSLIMAFSVFNGGSIFALAAGSELYYYYSADGEERFQFAEYCEVLTDEMTTLEGNETGKWFVTGYVSPKGFAGTPAIEHSLTVSGKVNTQTNPLSLYERCGFSGKVIWHVLTKKQIKAD